MYAIIATGGKQYKVAEGDVIRVESLEQKLVKLLHLTRYLLGKQRWLKVGEDVANASVTASVVENGKAKKLSFTNIREKPVTTRKTVTDSSLQK